MPDPAAPGAVLTCRAKLADIAELRPGFAPRAGAGAQPLRPIVLGRDLVDHEVIDWPHLSTCSASSDVSRFVLCDGDVLLMTRTTAMRAAVVRAPPSGVLASAQFTILRPHRGQLDGAYLASYLNRDSTRRRLRAIAKGSTIAFVATNDLRELEIELPSLERQRAIARVHELRAIERKLVARLERLRDSALDAALFGSASRR